MFRFFFILFFSFLAINSKGIDRNISLDDMKIASLSSVSFEYKYLMEMMNNFIAERGGNRLVEVSLNNKNKKISNCIIISSMKYFIKNDLNKNYKFEATVLNEEGFQIHFDSANNNILLLGADKKGILYGIGYLLRKLKIDNKLRIDISNLNFSSNPVLTYRGHQLGYRNQANSYDAWNPEQFEKYIQELAIFGTNAIENIPWEDTTSTPLMKYSRDSINKYVSKVCEKLGIGYWIWQPSEVDLTDSNNFSTELNKFRSYFKNTPYLSGVRFPTGDPGGNPPGVVLNFLRAVGKELKQYHPNAELWMSLQWFNEQQLDFVFDYLNRNSSSSWLDGIFGGPGGPQVSIIRQRLSKEYKVMDYPDITHNVRCQYPVNEWDQSFAIVEGREISNPRPVFFSKIFRSTYKFTMGFISYSDGIHDDLNKIIWSSLAWDPNEKVSSILSDYCNFFFKSGKTDELVAVLYSLEKNWDGAIKNNTNIKYSFDFARIIEKENPSLGGNWRFQLIMLRIYYDYYVYLKRYFDDEIERNVGIVLESSQSLGVSKSIDSARYLLSLDNNTPIFRNIKSNIRKYCELLFDSIGLQTSVKKYYAKNEERGAVLDFIGIPLNNAFWLIDRMDEISKLSSDLLKSKALEDISNWKGNCDLCFYDDIGNPEKEPHVIGTKWMSSGVAWWNNGFSRERLSQQSYMNYPELLYENYDLSKHYQIKISGEGDALLRINGDRIIPSLYSKGKNSIKLFYVPFKYSRSGRLHLTFDIPEESNLNWRYRSKIFEIWMYPLD